MISISDKHYCTGCSACAQVCPRRCIEMHSDDEGFLYPFVNQENCIGCCLCESVCPVLSQKKERHPIESFAAKSISDKVRYECSSGGVFPAIATEFIEKGGVVFGARFDDNWEVIHSFINDVAQLPSFYGSKYAQSLIGSSFSMVKRLLDEGEEVLFSGTPCQVSGLYHYLGSRRKGLVTVEVFCHGVPSPKVWKEYIADFGSVQSINFRNKASGWRQYSFSINSNKCCFKEKGSDNLYIRSFIMNYNLRPSCYKCSFKCGKSGADIAIGDYWGIWNYHPEFDDNLGVSAILIYTDLGKSIIDSARLVLVQTQFESIVSGNSCLVCSSKMPLNRSVYWTLWKRHDTKALKELLFPKQCFLKRLIRSIKK